MERYHFQDVAAKVVGVGSVGTRCLLALFLADEDDPLFLQVKEAGRSVLESPHGKSSFAHQGFRVVEGQRLMQAASDIFLGWFRSKHGRDFYVRQFRDMKVSAEVETFIPDTLVAYATLCGWAVARAHARSGNAAMIAGYLGSSEHFDNALVVAEPIMVPRSMCMAIKHGRSFGGTMNQASALACRPSLHKWNPDR